MSRNSKPKFWPWFLSVLVMILFIAGTVEFFRPGGRFSPAIMAERSLEKSGFDLSPASVFQAAEAGDAKTLRLLARAGQGVSFAGEEEMTPLMLAASRGDDPSVRALLESGAEVNARDVSGRTALSHALRRSLQPRKLTHLLYLFGANADCVFSPRESVLSAALRGGNYKDVKGLLDHGANPNWIPPEGLEESPLRLAVGCGNADFLRLLLENGADVHADDLGKEVRPPLFHLAANLGNAEICRQLVIAGCDPDERFQGATPLRNAVLERRIAFAEALVSLGASVQALEKEGDEPILNTLARKGDVESCRLLFELGFSHKESPSQPSPLELAWRSGSLEVFARLLENGVSPKRLHWELIAHRALPYLDLLVGDGLDLNELGEGGATPLGFALAEHDFELANYLLLNGANPDGVCDNGQPALVEAVAQEWPDMVSLLLRQGADPNAVLSFPASKKFRRRFPNDEPLQHSLAVDRKLTPLMLAAAMGSEQLVKILLGGGAKKWAKTSRYESYALYLAGMRRHVGVQQILVGRDPSPHHQERKIEISLSRQYAVVTESGQVTVSTQVSTGKQGHPTPKGTFVLTSKHRHHRSNLYDDASMPYFMRLSCDAFGLHEGRVPDYPASHGCIRVPAGTARTLFSKMKVGDLVIIRE